MSSLLLVANYPVVCVLVAAGQRFVPLLGWIALDSG